MPDVRPTSHHTASVGIEAWRALQADRPDVAAALAEIKRKIVADAAEASDDFTVELARQQHKQIAKSKAHYVSNAPDIESAVTQMTAAQKGEQI